MSNFLTRTYSANALQTLIAHGVPPLLARIYAARGVADARELAHQLADLLPFEQLRGCTTMAALLADAIESQQRLLIVGDYDADGATACALGVRALRQFGARADYLVPNRFEYGYGLTPEIVEVAAQSRPDILITVDNGIASGAGVARANALGMQVLITDHHLPGPALPAARCIVNPNQPGCEFPSKHLAGVGVMFYVMLATRAELRRRGAFSTDNEPNLARLLDLVALGTVADVVKLDRNNRLLVTQGVRRIRAGAASPGVLALLRVSGREPERSSSHDLGYFAAPRLNAAGRLQDISLGIECLLSDDPARALEIAQRLDALNRERRDIEADMRETAATALANYDPAENYSITLFNPDWHQGVVGLLAARLKDKFHRPAIVFARGGDGQLRGSGRSIAGLHLRDALDLVDKRQPGLLDKFGGHAAAAGVSIAEPAFPAFQAAFEQVTRHLLGPADLERVIETDGSLPEEHTTLELAHALAEQIWGQGFAPPSFCDEFVIEEQRIVGERHSRLRVRRAQHAGGRRHTAILFAHTDPLPARARLHYRLSINRYNGAESVEFVIDHWHPAP